MQFFQQRHSLVDALAGSVVTVGCDLVNPSRTCRLVRLLGQVADLQRHFFAQKGVEIILWQDDAFTCQCTFSLNIGCAECVLVNGHTCLLVPLPEHFAPVHPTAIEGAAVIKDNTFNHYRNNGYSPLVKSSFTLSRPRSWNNLGNGFWWASS